MKNLLYMLLVGVVFITNNVFANKPSGSVYLDGGDNQSALILAHGRGKYPIWKVVNPLRIGVHEELGFHTLSLQMPNDYKNWKKYALDFPEAYGIINKAIKFLKEEKGIATIYLMGHSMGSRMATSFMSENPNAPISGLIIAGCRNNGIHPLSCDENLQGINIPVLDIWGGNNDKDIDSASDRKSFISQIYKQVEIPGANHKFDGYEDEFVSAVVDWLQAQ